MSWMSDLVKPRLFIKLLDIYRDWAMENMYEDLGL